MMGSFRYAKYDNTGVGIDDPNAQATYAKVGGAVPGDGISAAVRAYLASAQFQPRPAANAGTVTFGTSTSALNGGVNGAVTVLALAPGLRYNCPIADDTYRVFANNVRAVDGSGNGVNSPLICAIQTDEPQIEACVRGTQFAEVTAWVHDHETGLTVFPRAIGDALPNTGSPVNVLFSLGANTKSQQICAATRSAAGSGYAIGDRITLAGGTASTPAVVEVIQSTSGGATTVKLVEPGVYSALPSSPATQASTTGSGTGATFTFVSAPIHSTKRMRTWYFCQHGSSARFHGFNLPAGATWQPASVNGPKFVSIGDSQSAGTYLTRPAGQMGLTVAAHLGLFGCMPSVNAAGGSGWLKANTAVTPNLPAWSSASRVQDFIAENGQIYLWAGSQNDDDISVALEDAVYNTVRQVLLAVPGSIHFGTSSVLDNGGHAAMAATHAAAWARLSAEFPGRAYFINNIAAGWFGAAANADYLSSDGAHYGQAGVDRFAALTARAILATVAAA